MKHKFLTIWLLLAATAAFAQTAFLSESEQNVYLQHKDEIDARLVMAKEDQYRELITTYSIKLVYVDELQQILGMQEMRKLICDYAQPTDHRARFWQKKAVENDYRNPIDKIILLSGNDISSPAMYIVFLFKDYLKLTDGQLDSLVVGAIGFKQILKNEPRKDLWKQELELLQNTLTEDQLNRFFDQKNSRTALRDAKQHWNRLLDNGLTNDLDSVRAVNQMYAHILKKQQAADIYYNDEVQKREAWTAIDQYAPLPMRRSYAINKKNTAKRQDYRGSFNW